MNKKIVFLLAIPALTCMSLSCNTTKHSTAKTPGMWQAQPIIVDGDSKDWPSPYPNYDAKAMIGYATSNDAENLYITMETGDEYTQMKLLKAGMTVYIDTGGGKEQPMSINYPMIDENNPLEVPEVHEQTIATVGQKEGRQKDMTKRIKNSVSYATQVLFDGFGACSGGHLASQNACGIKVRVAMDEYNELVWEAAIPFKMLYNKNTIDKSFDGKPISVCFAIKGIKKPAEKSQNTSSMGNTTANGSMNMSGARGGNRGGGRGKMGGASNPRDQMFESTKTWKQFGLVYK